MKRLYRHALIASEDSPKLLNADVLVEAGRIIGVAPEITGVTDCEIIDCTGRILLPSLFDIHVHAREPGQEDKENIASCAEAAINGGVTGFVMMPNTSPAIDNAGVVRTVLESARRTRIGATLFTTGAITKGRKGEDLAGIAAMKSAGVVTTQSFGSEPPLPFDKPAAQHRTSGVTAVWRASKAALMRRCTFSEPITSAHAQAKVTALRFAHPHPRAF